MKLTKEQEAAIIGMILGDGYLQPTGKKNARLRLEHQMDHKDYLVWKTKLLPRLFQGRPTILKRRQPVTQRIYSYVRQQSNSSPNLGRLRRIFYKNGKKVIPKGLEKWLKSEITLAIWYLDDGYYYPRDKCAYLYLGKVSKEEAKEASNSIKKKYGIENRVIDKKEKGFALYFSRRELGKLKTKIKKYTVPVMAYKIKFT